MYMMQRERINKKPHPKERQWPSPPFKYWFPSDQTTVLSIENVLVLLKDKALKKYKMPFLIKHLEHISYDANEGNYFNLHVKFLGNNNNVTLLPFNIKPEIIIQTGYNKIIGWDRLSSLKNILNN